MSKTFTKSDINGSVIQLANQNKFEGNDWTIQKDAPQRDQNRAIPNTKSNKSGAVKKPEVPKSRLPLSNMATYRLPRGHQIKDNTEVISMSITLDDDMDDTTERGQREVQQKEKETLNKDQRPKTIQADQKKETSKRKKKEKVPIQEHPIIPMEKKSLRSKSMEPRPSRISKPTEPTTNGTSIWLDNKLKTLSNEEKLKEAQINVSTDTFELDRKQEDQIRQLEERIEDLECENKLKDRELDTYKWIEKEQARKLKNQENLKILRDQMQHVERQADLAERLKRDAIAENQRLNDVIREKEREIRALQSELTNLDLVIEKTLPLKEEETIRDLYHQLEKAHSKSDLLQRDLDLVQRQGEELKRQLEETESTLKEETSGKDRQLHELKGMLLMTSGRLEKLDKTKEELEKRLEEAQKKGELLAKVTTEKEELVGQNAELCRQLACPEREHRHQEEKRTVEENVAALSAELEKMTLERNIMEKDRQFLTKKCNTIEALMKEQGAEEEALQRELSQLKHYAGELEIENDLLRQNESSIRHLQEQLNQIKMENSSLENHVISQSNQMRSLQKRDIEKDGCIRKLVDELKARDHMLGDTSTHYAIPQLDAPIYESQWKKPGQSREQSNFKSAFNPAGSPPTRETDSSIPLPSTRIGNRRVYSPTYDEQEPIKPQKSKKSEKLPSEMGVSYTIANEFGDREPDPPIDFHVSLILSPNSILFEWKKPHLDELNQNNGLELIGYVILFDGKEIHRVESPHLTKALLHPHPFAPNSVLAIQSLAFTGQLSRPIEIDLLNHDEYLTNEMNTSLNNAEEFHKPNGVLSNASKHPITSLPFYQAPSELPLNRGEVEARLGGKVNQSIQSQMEPVSDHPQAFVLHTQAI